MAMGDNVRTRNLLNYNQARGENLYGNANAAIGAQGQQFQADYGAARQSDEAMRGAAQGGYQNFMNTGGFTPMGIAAMRARAISPIRAAYANAQRDIGRHTAMGGTTAGANVLRARMAREQGQAGADATTNAEAGIAQMIQQGKLQGLGGMTSLYGTAPGATGLFSRNVIANQQQGLDLTENENQRMAGLLGVQNAQNQAPGKGGTALNMLGQGVDIGQKVGAGIFGQSAASKGLANIFK